MIFLILQTYLPLIISIVTIALIILVIGFYLILRTPKVKIVRTVQPLPTENQYHNFSISTKDIKAIAGEDEIATQLDLAKAYLESGRLQLAKKILTYVSKTGTAQQKKEAEVLIGK